MTPAGQAPPLAGHLHAPPPALAPLHPPHPPALVPPSPPLCCLVPSARTAPPPKPSLLASPRPQRPPFPPHCAPAAVHHFPQPLRPLGCSCTSGHRGSPGPTVRGRPSQRPLLRLRAPSLRRYPFLRGAPSLGPPPPPSPRGPLRCPELLLSAPSPGAVLGPPGRGAGAAPLTWDSGCGRAVCSPKAQQDGGPGSGQRRAQRGGGAGRCRSERVWSGPHHPDLGLRLRLQRWPRPGPAHAPPRGGVRVSLAPSLLPTGVHVSRGP